LFNAFRDGVKSSVETDIYDLVSCTTEFHSANSLPHMLYDVDDLRGETLLYNESNGNYATSISDFSDEANGGQNNWTLVKASSTNSCENTYCTFNCHVFRPIDTRDENDIKIYEGGQYDSTSGYRVLANQTIQARANDKGISTSRKILMSFLNEARSSLVITGLAVGTAVISNAF